jgi:hypothetical protein
VTGTLLKQFSSPIQSSKEQFLFWLLWGLLTNTRKERSSAHFFSIILNSLEDFVLLLQLTQAPETPNLHFCLLRSNSACLNSAGWKSYFPLGDFFPHFFDYFLNSFSKLIKKKLAFLPQEQRKTRKKIKPIVGS